MFGPCFDCTEPGFSRVSEDSHCFIAGGTKLPTRYNFSVRAWELVHSFIRPFSEDEMPIL